MLLVLTVSLSPDSRDGGEYLRMRREVDLPAVPRVGDRVMVATGGGHHPEWRGNTLVVSSIWWMPDPPPWIMVNFTEPDAAKHADWYRRLRTSGWYIQSGN